MYVCMYVSIYICVIPCVLYMITVDIEDLVLNFCSFSIYSFDYSLI
jgi:hypothetical protein